MFKKNDKIKLKSGITDRMLGKIGLCLKYFKESGEFVKFCDNHYSMKVGEKGNDVLTKFSDARFPGGFHKFYVPSAWIELAARKGHHLTKIFQ